MKLNAQVLQDRLHLQIGRLGSRPFFRHGLDTPPLEEHLRIVDFKLPRMQRPGREEFAAATLAGELRAALRLYAAGGPAAPVLIYHHDLGEIPPGRTLELMFARNHECDLTIYVIEAPFHRSAREAKLATLSLHDYLSMIAVLILATERLIEIRCVAEAPLRTVAGFGQGGTVANRHHMLYDSADLYLPFMAGTAPAETFLPREYRTAAARNHAGYVRERLNFDAAWGQRSHDNVFPVLGSADYINRFDPQSRSYGETPIEVWNTGHIAATKQPGRMREKILKHLSEARAAPLTARIADDP
jgi:hypothetical protein